MPLKGPEGSHSITASAPAVKSEGGTFASELEASERAGTVEVQRSAPPLEVLDQMAAAARVHDQMQQEGRELRFSVDGSVAGVAIELHDAETDTTTALTSAQALDIAAGKPLG
jgi:hypothetical protein